MVQLRGFIGCGTGAGGGAQMGDRSGQVGEFADPASVQHGVARRIAPCVRRPLPNEREQEFCFCRLVIVAQHLAAPGAFPALYPGGFGGDHPPGIVPGGDDARGVVGWIDGNQAPGNLMNRGRCVGRRGGKAHGRPAAGALGGDMRTKPHVHGARKFGALGLKHNQLAATIEEGAQRLEEWRGNAWLVGEQCYVGIGQAARDNGIVVHGAVRNARGGEQSAEAACAAARKLAFRRVARGEGAFHHHNAGRLRRERVNDQGPVDRGSFPGRDAQAVDMAPAGRRAFGAAFALAKGEGVSSFAANGATPVIPALAALEVEAEGPRRLRLLQGDLQGKTRDVREVGGRKALIPIEAIDLPGEGEGKDQAAVLSNPDGSCILVWRPARSGLLE